MRISERFDGGIGERIEVCMLCMLCISERVDGWIAERIDGGIGDRFDDGIS